MKNTRPITVITGASDGIGYCLAELYNEMGHTVVATGRRAWADISPALSPEIQYIRADLATDSGIKTLLATIGNQPIALLIQNAGIGWFGAIRDQALESSQTILDLNLNAPMAISHGLYKNLSTTNGQIVFIGSSAVNGATPQFATYTASKAALSGFARSLALEWEGQIKVQMIHPCPTATDMHAKVGLKRSQIMRLFPTPQTVATAIVRKIDQGRDYRFGLGFILRHALASWSANS